MIDLHTHLDLYPNVLNILDRVNEENYFTLAVTTSPQAWLATSQVFKKYENIKVSLGLHPEIAAQKFNELDFLLSSIHKAEYIGEVGIDASTRHLTMLNTQKLIFDNTLRECEKAGGRIISIHSRGAVSMVLSTIRKYPNCGIPILHWFSGTIAEIEEAIEMRCYFSINPLMLQNKTGFALVSRIPAELVLPESDGPFAALNGKSIMPWDAMDICFGLKNIWNISHQETKAQIISNFNTLTKEHGHNSCVPHNTGGS